ncbi:MAG: ubiquinone biosynthesis regulatory protein kinase UbiB [Pseudomonadota bacterium]
MRLLRQFYRIIQINVVLVRNGLEEVILAIHLFRPIRFILLLLPWHWFRSVDISHGVRIRKTLEDLGPIFVKFGQALSTRRDLLPDEIADELAKLQDRVPPFPGEEARAIVEKALGAPVTEVFSKFDEQPLASASIAQVHAATLHDGSDVVVKVLRPDVHKLVKRDMEVLELIANLAHRYWVDGRRLRPREVVADYEQTVMDELDLLREAANASQLRRNFEDSSDLYVPQVYWDYCRVDVMVMERIHGIAVNDVKKLKENHVNMKKLSERGVHIFFTQVFQHNFFHADMHPGNIFVSYETPEDPKYLGVDFGIMGTLTIEDQRYLAENLLAFFNRDYRRVAELHLESGWVPANTRIDHFESAIRTVCEPIFQKPISEISFGNLLLRLFQTARRFQMEVQPQLVLLQKTLLNIEGLGRQLDPELDLWQTAKPFLDRWMSEQVGLRALVKGMKSNLPKVLEQAPELPSLVYQVLQQVNQQNHTHEARLQEEIQRLEKQNQKQKWVSVYIATLGVAVAVAVAYFV